MADRRPPETPGPPGADPDPAPGIDPEPGIEPRDLISHGDAARYLRELPPVTRQTFHDHELPEMRARAFLIEGVESLDVVARVRDLIAALPEGQDWHETRRQIVQALEPWLGPEAERRATRLLEHHHYHAYHAAKVRHLERHRRRYPYWRYDTRDDRRVRRSHAALDGLVLPVSSPFWERHTPPWAWGCRCTIKALRPAEAAAAFARDARRPAGKRVQLSLDARRQLEQHGTLRRGREIFRLRQEWAGGPKWNPRDIAITRKWIRERYDEKGWARFQAWARQAQIPEARLLSGGRATVLGWLEGETILSALPGAARRYAKARSGPAGAQSAVGIHAVADYAPGPDGQPMPAAERRLYEAAMNAIDTVHDVGVMPDLKLVSDPETVRRENARGLYNEESGQASIDPQGPWPTLTAVHEISHHLYGFWKHSETAQSPEARQAMRDLEAELGKATHLDLLSGEVLEEASKPWELFARAYVQYLHDQIPTEWATLQGSSDRILYWNEGEFQVVRDKIDKLLHAHEIK